MTAMNIKTLLKIANFYIRFTPNYTKIGYLARRLFRAGSAKLDFSGQRWVITGASSGLGKSMVHTAANAGAEVIAVARSQENLDSAISELESDAAARVTTMVSDLSLQSGTQDLLDRLLASSAKIDVLMNNVGLLLNEFSLTSEGRETSFATNILSHFLLTEGLADNDGFTGDAVVVNMTSGGMYNAPLGIAGLNRTQGKSYNGKASYAFAKRAQVSLTPYWNRKYADKGIRFYVTHPGWSRTPGVKTALPIFWKLQYLILRTPRQGADTAIWLCANRPAVTEEDNVWFDRKPRTAHVYEATKTPQCTVEELAEYLRTELTAQTEVASASTG